MCEELVKRLRNCASDTVGNCDGCPYQGYKKTYCINGLITEAANAIEKLQQMVDASIPNSDAEIIISEVAKAQPKWISVTERLPEEYTDVLCYYEYFRYGDYNCMFRTIDRGYFGNGRWGGEAGQGRKNKVLAWMPLPEPPKETI